ncbi:MAG: hypothetical protein DRO73_10195 [Candidatus Thorarchaeota archaeon]|nr:MAG: hypothetical protein DRO73_10195 [Candidatus Thorarchaeota archaeon]
MRLVMRSCRVTSRESRAVQVMAEEWNTNLLALVYGIGRGDLEFLGINDAGQLTIQFESAEIPIVRVIEKAGLSGSFNLRIPYLVAARARRVEEAFRAAIGKVGLAAAVLLAYPVKVSAYRLFLRTFLHARSNYGLQVGSSNELKFVLSLDGLDNRLIVCDGVKTQSYLHLAERAVRKRYRVVITIGSVADLTAIVDYPWTTRPEIALRLKAYSTVPGHWSHATGRHSKFGLAADEVKQVAQTLTDGSLTDTATTVMMHPGSQVQETSALAQFGEQIARVYLELREQGLDSLQVIDIGGGIPVDYTGTGATTTPEAYAENLMRGVTEGLQEASTEELPRGFIVESGRYIMAPSSMVVVKIIDVRSVYPSTPPTTPNAERTVKSLVARLRSANSVEEIEGILSSVEGEDHGKTLESMVQREVMLGMLVVAARQRLAELGIDPPPSNTEFLKPRYLVTGEFSVFNSIIDHLIVDQYFPVIPVTRLRGRPRSTVRLVDMTCDSDGEISKFCLKNLDRVLLTEDFIPLTTRAPCIREGIPIPEIKSLQNSHVVIALTGAYQDTVISGQGMFARLPSVVLDVMDDGSWSVDVERSS